MAKVTPQVVILGKGKQSELKATHNLIKSIQPSSVPPELLDSVFLTLVDDTRYQIIDLDATKNILTDASNSILNDLFEE